MINKEFQDHPLHLKDLILIKTHKIVFHKTIKEVKEIQ